MKKKIYEYRLLIIAVVIIIGISLLVISNNKKKDIIEELQSKEDIKAELKADYNLCNSYAYLNYTTNWNLTCKSQGKKDNCESLPRYLSETLFEEMDEAEEKCLETYKTMSLIELK